MPVSHSWNQSAILASTGISPLLISFLFTSQSKFRNLPIDDCADWQVSFWSSFQCGSGRTWGPWIVQSSESDGEGSSRGAPEPWSPCPRAVRLLQSPQHSLEPGWGGRDAGGPGRPVRSSGSRLSFLCLLQQHDWAVMLRKAADSYEKKAAVNITKCLVVSFHIWNFGIIMGLLRNLFLKNLLIFTI